MNFLYFTLLKDILFYLSLLSFFFANTPRSFDIYSITMLQKTMMESLEFKCLFSFLFFFFFFFLLLFLLFLFSLSLSLSLSLTDTHTHTHTHIHTLWYHFIMGLFLPTNFCNFSSFIHLLSPYFPIDLFLIFVLMFQLSANKACVLVVSLFSGISLLKHFFFFFFNSLKKSFR